MSSRLFLAAVILVVSVPSARAQTLLPPLTDQEVREVRATIEAMKRDPRGPYLRLRWFCADGTVQPPAGSPCRERGGGVQHAEYSEAAHRLAQLGFHVGTILQATPIEDLFDVGTDHYRLKELVVARHLFEVDDGWALRRAQYYRGARQIEDEEVKGQQLLEWLLGRPAWVASHYLLAVQLVGTVPHAALGHGQTTQTIRNLATEIATRDSAFTPIRIRIHSFPSPADLSAVIRFLETRSVDPETGRRLVSLRDALRRQYDARANLDGLVEFERRVPPEVGERLRALRAGYSGAAALETLARLADLTVRLRQIVSSSRDGRMNLRLLDLNLSLQQLGFVLAQELEAGVRSVSRQDRVRRMDLYVRLAVGGGFLSYREAGEISEELNRLAGAPSLTALEYKNALTYVARALDWATAATRSGFAPVLARYTQVEPSTTGFVDATVRGSPVLSLSVALDRLHRDADSVLGASHTIFGDQVRQGVRGLNPGVALRPLRVLDPADLDAPLDPAAIYVIPQTTAELRPVAGVLTLDEGNLLSHVQLLARNLGIPNAVVASAHLPRLRAFDGRETFYAVSPLGLVVLKAADRLAPAERALVDDGSRSRQDKIRLDTSRLRLERTEPIPLHRLRAEDSGVFVGPKAANLGQLAALFPDKVAPGVALPFGMFARHIDRPFESDQTVTEVLAAAYREVERMRRAGRPEDEIDRHMFDVLARVRRAIVELPWQPEVRQAIVRAVHDTFGDAVGRGVFIRSDTNVEDLPQFSGAGLNLTVPHRRSVDDILTAVRRVWTSPFSERAYLWRKQILSDQGQVYPSVLLLRSIHSSESGVLITTGLQGGGPDDLTITTGEGVGGAVEGEEAETLRVTPAGRVILLSQAKAPYRRALVDSGEGGVTMVPANMPDTLLDRSEIQELRAVVRRWKQQLRGPDTARVWDMEFGFADGKLWLFQVRPFIGFRNSALLGRLGVLDRDVLRNRDRPVRMGEPI